MEISANQILIVVLVIYSIIITVLYAKKNHSSEKFNNSPNTYANFYKNVIPHDGPTQGDMMAMIKSGIAPSTNDSAYKKVLARVNAYKPRKDGKDEDGNVIKYYDEVCLKLCCQLALRSVSFGNFGIGCVVADPLNKLKPYLEHATVVIDGKTVNYLDHVHGMMKSFGWHDPENHPVLKTIVGVGLNMIFYQGWEEGKQVAHVRSDRHGEMVCMDMLEDAIASVPYQKEWQTRTTEGLTLYTQLESCPMCTGRLASSSISGVLHGAPDNGGGMVHKLCDLPPIFIGLTSTQTFAPASITGKVDGSTKNSLMQLCFDSFAVNVGTVGTKQNNRVFGCPDNCPNFKYCMPDADPALVKRQTYDPTGWTRY